MGSKAHGENTTDRMLTLFHPLRIPVLRSAIGELKLPKGSQGLDAGCGTGLPTLLLAEALGSNGHVTGLDRSSALLINAAELMEKSGLSKQVAFQEGDINDLPFQADTFDWAWSVDCVGYAPMATLPLLKELTRVVRPGGKVAVLFWSSQQLLPGYPLLEARLNATSSGIAPFIKGNSPESHPLRALARFREAGLDEPTARTFAGDAHAPLTDTIRSALKTLFEMRWPGVESELTLEDLTEYQRLCQPASQDFILNLPDYYAFFTYSMFTGMVLE